MTEHDKNSLSVPEWLLKEENYIPKNDKSDAFVTKSLLKLTSVLSKIRQSGANFDESGSVPLRMLCTLAVIILMALSRNMMFSWCVMAFALVRACFLKGDTLKRTVVPAFSVAVITAIFLLPAVFLGSPRTMLTVSCKVLTSLILVNLMASTVPWNRMTASLRFFHVPNVFIFTFDTALRFIALLGEVAVNMLEAVKLRTVGRNKSGGKSLSGVLGTAFLKSREMSDEMFDAMTCRGFDGEYPMPKREKLSRGDFVYLILTIICIAVFIYFEMVI